MWCTVCCQGVQCWRRGDVDQVCSVLCVVRACSVGGGGDVDQVCSVLCVVRGCSVGGGVM